MQKRAKGAQTLLYTKVNMGFLKRPHPMGTMTGWLRNGILSLLMSLSASPPPPNLHCFWGQGSLPWDFPTQGNRGKEACKEQFLDAQLIPGLGTEMSQAVSQPHRPAAIAGLFQVSVPSVTLSPEAHVWPGGRPGPTCWRLPGASLTLLPWVTITSTGNFPAPHSLPTGRGKWRSTKR